MMIANKKKFNKIILNNVNDIKQFITSNISDCKVDKSPYKILINCPYCDKGKHKHKMIINLDWVIIAVINVKNKVLYLS